MKASELADLYDAPYEYPEWGSKAQAMLRQQQAEIEALKEALKILVGIAESTDIKWESQKPIYKLAIMQAKERLKNERK